jgi:hypothetical protein
MNSVYGKGYNTAALLAVFWSNNVYVWNLFHSFNDAAGEFCVVLFNIFKTD